MSAINPSVSRTVSPSVKSYSAAALGMVIPGDPIALWDIKGGVLQPDSIGISGTENVFWFGDSLTLGTATSYKSIHGSVINEGIGGETSTQIAARFYPPTKSDDIVVIWAGNNDPLPTETILANVAGMVAGAGSRYLVLGLLINAMHAPGSTTHNGVLADNAALSAAYGSKFINILDYLKTQYDPENPQDVIDVANGITPSSLRTDDIHLNATGKALVAARVHQELITLGYLLDPLEKLTIKGVAGNCLTTNGNGMWIRIQEPPGYPSISTAVKFDSGGSSSGFALTGGVDRTINPTNAGTLYNLRIKLSGGLVIRFPLNEGGGSTVYGYVESDGAVYIGHITSSTAVGGDISQIWAGSQDLYHHAWRYGCGLISAGSLGPEKLFRTAERDFSEDIATWVKGTSWAVTGGEAVHTGTSGGFLTQQALYVKGETVRASYDVPTFGGALIGLSGSTVSGGYVSSAGSKTKDYVTLDRSFAFYSTSTSSIDNVSVKSIYQADARCPANPVTGLDCRGNAVTTAKGFSNASKYAIPATAALIAADDGTFFDVSDVPIAKTLTELLALQGDQFFFSLSHGRPVFFAIYGAPLTGAPLVRADRYFDFA